MFSSPPMKSARTERHTLASATVTSVAHTSTTTVSGTTTAVSTRFIAHHDGTSTRSFTTTTNNTTVITKSMLSKQHITDTVSALPLLPICGMGKELAWSYAPGSKHLVAWSTLSGKKLGGTHNEEGSAHGVCPAPIFKPEQGDIAFIAECDINDPTTTTTKKGLVFCSSLGTVLSADGSSIAFNFEYEDEASGTARPFHISSFATSTANQQISAPMFHEVIPSTQHILAGTEDGYVLCAFKRENTNSHNASSSSEWEVLFCNIGLAEAECAPAIAADLDIIGGGRYLFERQATNLPARLGRDKNNGSKKGARTSSRRDAASVSSSATTTKSWWRSWLPLPAAVAAGKDANDTDHALSSNSSESEKDDAESYAGLNRDTPAPNLIGSTGSSKVLSRLNTKKVEHIQAAQNGVAFTVGGQAIAFVTKVASAAQRSMAAFSASSDEGADGSLPQNGLKLVWSCPLAAIVSPDRRASIAALTTSGASLLALVVFDDDLSSGHLVSLSSHTGAVTSSRAVQLPVEGVHAALSMPSAASASDDLPRIAIFATGNADSDNLKALSIAGAASSPSSSPASIVSVVVGNTITHFSLGKPSVRNPCVSTDVESIANDVLATGICNGDLFVLTKDGPFRSSEAAELEAATARKELSSLLDIVRSTFDADRAATASAATHEGSSAATNEAVKESEDAFVTSNATAAADAAVLVASDAILYSAETHSQNWARVLDPSSAEEDLSVLTFITAQLHRRQIRHRSFVMTVLGCEELRHVLSNEAIAQLISDQEKILALRYLRDLQNADVRDGLHEAIQHYIRRGVVAVATKNRPTARICTSATGGGSSARASNAEVFFADHNSVIDLMMWAADEMHLLSGSLSASHMTSKVEAAIALGNLCPRILEATYESRNTLVVPSHLKSLMWTDAGSRGPAGSVGDAAGRSDCDALVQKLAVGLSDVLELAARYNMGLAGTHNGNIAFATASAQTNSNVPVPHSALQALLSLIESLVRHALSTSFVGVEAYVTPSSPTTFTAGQGETKVSTAVVSATSPSPPLLQTLAGSPTFDYAAYIRAPHSTLAESLLARTLLRQPFLCPAHVSAKTGNVYMYGYPYGAPKANPQCLQLSNQILAAAEALAAQFKVYGILYAFSLSDPNAIEAFTAAIETSSALAHSTPHCEAAAASAHYAKYQEYCRTVQGFYVASLHMMLMDHRFQREHEVCHSVKLCGLDRELHRPAHLRNVFLKTFAPQLLWVAVPEFVDYVNSDENVWGQRTNAADNDDNDSSSSSRNAGSVDFVPTAPVGGEASLALLREGKTAHNSLNIPAGPDVLSHRSNCAALARLCWFAYQNEEDRENKIGEGDVHISHDPSTVFSRAQHKAFGAHVPAAINQDLTIVGFQHQFFGGDERMRNSILAAPQLVEMLLNLPDDVDALRAAAVVCDSIGLAHASSHSEEKREKSSTTSPNVTNAELLRAVYAKAAKIDGGASALLTIASSSLSEMEAAKRIAATAQGRVVLASHALSGLPQPSLSSSSSSSTFSSAAETKKRYSVHVAGDVITTVSAIHHNAGAISVTAAFSPSSSAILNNQLTAKHAARNNLKTILGPLFGIGESGEDNEDETAKAVTAATADICASSPEEGTKILRVLEDWLKFGGAGALCLDAPSPAALTNLSSEGLAAVEDAVTASSCMPQPEHCTV